MALTKTTFSMIDGSVVNVLDYIPQSEHAAIRNVTSTYDCTSAFNAALATGRDVFVPGGRYRIESAINFTNRAGGYQKLFGEGWGIGGNGSIIQANTGGVAIDCTGSQFITIEDLGIESATGTLTNPATVGILTARSTVSQYAQFVTVRNVYVHMVHDDTANNNYGSVALYNCAAEIHHYDNVYLIADTPLALNPYNTQWAIASPYTTIDNSIVSMSMITVSGASTLNSTSTSRSCLFVRNAFGIVCENVYLTGSPATSTDWDGVVNFKFNGHLETGDKYVAFMRQCYGFDLRWTGGPTNVSPIWLGIAFTGIGNGSIMSDNVDVGWPFIIEGAVISTLGDIRINISGDDGVTPTTNLANKSAVNRTIQKSATNGGIQFQNVPDAMIFQAFFTGSAPINSLVHDPATGKICWKDNAGVVHPLY